MAHPTSPSAAGQRPIGQKVAGPALAAAGLYLAGYFLPLVSAGGQSVKLSDGEGGVWMWVVPAVLAIVAAVVGFTGQAVAGAVAAGVVTALAGMTTFQLLFIHRQYDAPGVSKGIGFWALALAVTTAFGTIVPLLTARVAADPKCEQVTSMLGAVAFAGVPLAVLLPADGFSPLSDIDDGLLKFGLVVWALVAPLAAAALALSRRPAGLAFAGGVALGHLGYTVMVLQSDAGAAVLGVGHTALYHWTTVTALVLTTTAFAGSLKAASGGAAEGRWAADPYGRHQYRLWDGTRWTANVSDHGVVGYDDPNTAVATPASTPSSTPAPSR